MSKKIMSVVFAIFMLASLCVVGMSSASAAYASVKVGSGEVGAKAGDEVHLVLTVDNLDGHYGVNGQIQVYFDNTKMTFVVPGRNDTNTYPAIPVVVPNYDQDGKFTDGNLMGLHFNYSDLNGYDFEGNDGVICNYTFKVTEDIEDLTAAFKVDVDTFSVYDKAGDPYNNKEIQGGGHTNIAVEGNMDAYFTAYVNGGTWNPTPATIDTSALEALIATAKAEAAKSDVYTAESIAALNEVIAAAEAVSANPESQAAVDAQVVALQAAVDALVLIEEPTQEPSESEPTQEPSESEPTQEPSETEPTTATEPSETTAPTTAAPTTEAPEAPQTGEASTAVVLMVVAIMAAGVVIFARKKTV